MRRVLVTGASGFIGASTLPFLIERGFDVHATSRFPRQSDGILWHPVDLFQREDVQALLSKVRPTHLLHLAWYVTPGKYWESVENLSWVSASLHLIHAFACCGGERAVCAGTCAEYDWQYGFLTEERTPKYPASLYGTSKFALFLLLQSAARTLGLRFAWGRVFHVYGPREHPSRLVPSVIRSAMHDGVVRCSHGNQFRDFLYVEDVASAFVTMLESTVAGAVNVGSGSPTRLRTIVESLVNLVNPSAHIEFGAIPTPANDPPFLVADVQRLQGELGWRPLHNMQLGLSRTIDWWKTNKTNIKNEV